MNDPPADEGQAGDGKYSVDGRGAHGMVVGDHNAQTNFFYYAASGGEYAHPPVITVSGSAQSPYRGLSAFGEQDAAFFFGRETATAEVLRRLAGWLHSPGQPPLVVSGVSGAGKSSLLRAGVLPRLAEIGLAPAPGGRGRLPVVFTPARDPLGELATAVASLIGTDAATLHRALRDDPGGLGLVARQATATPAGPGLLLLVIDQFEQLFAPSVDDAKRRAFITALDSAAAARHGQEQLPAALVVLAVRADFEARCAEHAELVDAVQDRYLVPPMTERQLRLAITGPPERLGASVAADLTDEFIRAAGESPVSLPHLSHALDQAWRSRAESDVLSLGDYERAGGIEGSIAASADRAYACLSAAQRTVAEPVFMRLVTTSSDLVVSAGRATQAELSAGTLDASDVQAVVEAFAAERLLTVSRDCVEISHEILLTAWDQLHGWLDGDRIDMARYSRLNADARDRDTAERPASYLYGTGRLAETDTAAKRWASMPARYPPLGPITGTFLDAARGAARRSRRRRRALMAVLSALTVLAGTAAGVAFRNGVTASRQHAIALSRQLAAESLTIDLTEPVTARQLAAAAR